MTSKVNRAAGLTASERFLVELADHTFLDLWSWPNVYKGPGKELCDLLVICGDDILIFSDKSIEWPSGNIEIAWQRWYRRAISKSVAQIRGAARWLQTSRLEIYADAKCNRRLPLELPPPERRRVHGICVALGAENAASAFLQDQDGTFMVFSHLKGRSHVDFGANGHLPFAIGDVDPDGPFVHVFNQLSLSVVMRELDTITDFTAYLTARESLIRSDRNIFSPSEMEMLANYLLNTRDGEHAFPEPEDLGAPADTMILQFAQGEYDSLVRSPGYKKRQETLRESYAWDNAIRLFTNNVFEGTQYRILNIDPTVQRAERVLRIMAKEDRRRRCGLGNALTGALSAQKEQKIGRFARILMPEPDSMHTGLAYIFMFLSGEKDVGHEKYRNIRSSLLETYCLSVLFDHRELETCVGIAGNMHSDEASSEDLIAINQLRWTTEEVERLWSARHYYEILLSAGE